MKAGKKKKDVTYKGTFIRLLADFSTETSQKPESDGIFEVLKGKNCQPKTLYLAQLSFRNQGERLLNKQELTEFIPIRPALQKC